ncbi:MAG: hypothetical protein M3463_17105 [Verrucomicrobiota bacterium]|nr:hypothetical protein [Verrucomicrobiota bacterium]
MRVRDLHSNLTLLCTLSLLCGSTFAADSPAPPPTRGTAKQPLLLLEARPVPVDNGDFEKGMDNWEGSGVIATDAKHGGGKSMLL